MPFVTLNEEQVFEISLLEENLPYKNGQRAKDGKTYSRYRYDGKVFTVPTENPFNSDMKSGNVSSVKLQETSIETTDSEGNDVITAGLQFDSHTSNTQLLALANHRANIAEVKARGEIATAKAIAVSKMDSKSLSELLSLA